MSPDSSVAATPYGAHNEIARPQKKEPSTLTVSRSQMKEVSASLTVAPFGKVNYWDLHESRTRLVRATILTDFAKERAKFGLAIDGSSSMKPFFESGNVRDVAQRVGTFFARRDWDGFVSLIYWATGVGDDGIQSLGEFAQEFAFTPPAVYGRKTVLLPALRYFTDGRQRPDLYYARWGIFAFLTDGAIEDLGAVKVYSTELATELSRGSRLGNIKLLLIGLGDRVDESQFDQLDDLETGTGIDLWDTKLLAEMRDLDNPYELFAEIIDPDIVLVPGDGIVSDSVGNVVADFREHGLTELLEFALPFGEPAFNLEVAGHRIRQPLPFADSALETDSVLDVFPLNIDFGFVENLAEQQACTVSIHNNGAGIWEGSVESDVPWLSARPSRLACPPDSAIELSVKLKPGAEAYLGPRLNSGLLLISGAGYEQAIRVTVAIPFRFLAFTTDEERVMEVWSFIHENLDLSSALLAERFKDLVHHFCNRLGLTGTPDSPKLTGEFCHLGVDASAVLSDTGLRTRILLVSSLIPELRDDHLAELDTQVSGLELHGRHVVLLLLFGEQVAVQETHRRVMAQRYQRTYNIVVLGGRQLWQIVYDRDPRQKLREFIYRVVKLEDINPFQGAGPADDRTFSGREFELSTISSNAHAKSFAVVGGRRIGKTSLLMQLHNRNLPGTGLQSLLYDCQPLAVPDLSFLNQEPKDWSPPLPPGHTARTFRELLEAIPTDKPLAILLDEIDQLIEKDAPASWPVLKTLRSLVNSRKLQIVACGAETLRRAMADPSGPLFNFFHSVLTLKRLEYAAVRNLVTRPLGKLEIDLSQENDIIRLIWQSTGGHPLVVQKLCANLLERVSRQPITSMSRRRVTPEDVGAVAQHPEFLANGFLDVYWEDATYLERIITLVLARVEDRPLSSLDIRDLLREQAGLNLRLREIQGPLDRLQYLRCILRQSPDGYVFDFDAFPQVLRRPNVITLDGVLELYLENYRDFGDVKLQPYGR